MLTTIEAWKRKAHRLIADMCRESYLLANKGRKRHVPYSVPADAAFLIECLTNNDEVGAKNYFIKRAIIRGKDLTC